MERMAEFLLVNALSAVPLALLALAAERWIRRPGLTHGLWLAVLARLVMPPIFEVPWVFERTGAVAGGLLTLPTVHGFGPLESSRSVAPSPGFGFGALTPIGWLLAGVLLGTVALLFLATLRTVRLWRTLRAASPAAKPLADRVEALAARLGLRSAPPTLLTQEAIVPMVWSLAGVRRLVLPEALVESLAPSELDGLLTHELVHLERGDDWVRHLELLVVALFWWYPLAWMARRRLRCAEEICCDLRVRQALPDHRRAYADCLLKTLRYLADVRRPVAVLASGLGTAAQLKGRLMMILSESNPRKVSAPLRWIATLLCLVALAWTPVMADPSVPETASTNPEASAYSGQPLAVAVEDRPVLDVLRRLAKVSGLNFVVAPETDLSHRVTIDESSMPWDQALDRVLSEAGLDYVVQGTVLWIGFEFQATLPSGPFVGQPIDLEYRNTDLREALVELGQLMDLEIQFDPGVEGMVSLELEGVPVDQALEILLRINDLEASTEEGVLQIVPLC